MHISGILCFFYVWDGQCLEDSERKDDLFSEQINQLIMKMIVEKAQLYQVC